MYFPGFRFLLPAFFCISLDAHGTASGHGRALIQVMLAPAYLVRIRAPACVLALWHGRTITPMARENLISLFRDFARFSREVAVVHRVGYRREAWTYAKLASKAAEFALELKARNIRAGDRVLLWSANSAEWVAAFWGCLLRGAVVVPLDDGSAHDFANRVANDAQVKLIVAARAKPALDSAIPRLVLEDFSDSLGKQNPLADQDVPRGTSQVSYANFAEEPITRNHIAQILFTSGTTAEPRGVVLTHEIGRAHV